MKIEFHYTYIIIAISFILTGYFSNLIIFTSIIIIHEFGHYVIAKLNKLNPDIIIIYPFGGITKMHNFINNPISKELIVAISGVLFQSIYYLIIIVLYKYDIIREYIFNLYRTYHYSILIFNLLPIHPLDGSIILNLILSKYLPYKLTLKLNVIISIITMITIISINYYKFNYTIILIITIIIDSLVKYYKNVNYIFNKFLIERYLYKIKPKRIKTINKINDMYKEKYHIFKEKNNYLTEKQVLNCRFKEKIWKMFDIYMVDMLKL